MAAARVLVVCRANQSRSPMVELYFRRTLANAPNLAWTVTSAGTRALDGRPIHPLAREVLAERGIDADGFRARRLSRALVAEASLVLTAERGHRAEVVALQPEALHRTFTLKQFARLVEAGTLNGRPSADACGIDGLVELARRARSLSEPGDDDLVDPIGRGRGSFVASAADVEAAVRTIVAAADRLSHNGHTLSAVALQRSTRGRPCSCKTI